LTVADRAIRWRARPRPGGKEAPRRFASVEGGFRPPVDGGVVTVPFGADGRIDLAALERAVDGETAAVIVGYPNFLGVVDALPEAAAIARKAGAVTISVTQEAVALGLLQAPGALGADVAVGTFQSFGNGMNFGGPAPGFYAGKEEHLRQLPGRICGATVDKPGEGWGSAYAKPIVPLHVDHPRLGYFLVWELPAK